MKKKHRISPNKSSSEQGKTAAEGPFNPAGIVPDSLAWRLVDRENAGRSYERVSDIIHSDRSIVEKIARMSQRPHVRGKAGWPVRWP